MMKLTRTYLKLVVPVIVSGLLILSGCQKDIDYILPDPVSGPDTTWVANPDSSMPVGQLQNSLLLQSSTDSFDLNPGTVLTVNTASGLRTTVGAGYLWNDSSLPVFGRIHVESMLLTKKGDFIRMGIPTSNEERILETGGAFLLRFRQNQAPLHVGPGRQVIGIFDVPNVFQDLFVYNGAPLANPLNFNWSLTLDSSANFVVAPGQSYWVYGNKLGWVSASRICPGSSSNNTRISLELPSNYTNKNSKAYLVLNNKLCVVPMNGNATQRKFISLPVPPGEQATVVVLSQQGNDYFMGSTQVTVGQISQGVQNVQLTPTITSLNNIKTFLSSL